MVAQKPKNKGFTLLELSIVLVIIGLLVGGVLVGRDLIAAAELRATIGQIEKYKTALNTFLIKYNAIPGDMDPTTASNLGFKTRAGGRGDGDGNTLIEGKGGTLVLGGETVLFWTDLSGAGLIDGSFTDNSDAVISVTGYQTLDPYLPAAKIASHPRFVAFNSSIFNNLAFDIVSVYLSNATGIEYGVYNQGMTPLQAFRIDSTIDDGLPLSGNVQESDGGRTGLTGWIGSGPILFGSTSGWCANNSPAQYIIANADQVVCNIIVNVK